MTMQKLASLISKREGKKSQAKIGDIREILKIIAQLEKEHRLDPDSPISESPIYVIESSIKSKK